MAKYSVIINRANEHMQCFEEIAESIHQALLELGHESSRKAIPGHRWIYFGAHVDSGALPDDAILYQSEQLGSAWFNYDYRNILQSHRTWHFTEMSVDRVQGLGGSCAHVPPAWHQCLQRIDSMLDPPIDVLFYGSSSLLRESTIASMRVLGLNVLHEFGVYGEARDNLIRQSKIVLNMPYYPGSSFEMARVGYCMNNRKCVVAERVSDAQWLQDGIVFASYHELARMCRLFARNPRMRASIADRGYEIYRSRPMIAYVANALESE